MVKTCQSEEGNNYPNTGSTDGPQKDEPWPRYIIIKIKKVKYRRKILKQTKIKQRVMYMKTP